MEEEWRRFVGFGSKHYEVSNTGKYRSLDRYVKSGRGNGTRLMKGKQRKLFRWGTYLYASIREDGMQKSICIHTMVAKAFPEICGEWFEGCQVDHLDCNVDNNCATNLRVCTASENMSNPLTVEHIRGSLKKYMSENGSPLIGRKHSEDAIEKMRKAHTKYTEEEIKEHRREYNEKNRDKNSVYWKEYYIAHRDKKKYQAKVRYWKNRLGNT